MPLVNAGLLGLMDQMTMKKPFTNRTYGFDAVNPSD